MATAPAPAGDGWAKRESAMDLFILGDARDGNHERVGGLLVDVTPDRQYEGNWHYHFEQPNGDVLQVPGSANLNRQIAPQDIGLFMKIFFKGFGRSRNGKFKEFEVNVFEGTPSPAMRAFPSYEKMTAIRAQGSYGRHPSNMSQQQIGDNRNATNTARALDPRDDPRQPMPDPRFDARSDPRAAQGNDPRYDNRPAARDDRQPPPAQTGADMDWGTTTDARGDLDRQADKEDDLPF